MSTFRVDIVEISDIIKHPNADKLEIAKVFDWNVIVRKDSYKKGDKAIYCPVDSILPIDLETKLFPPDSKIKLNRSRIKSIKIRGLVSQGMLINMSDVSDTIKATAPVGINVAEALGIIKYEPPVASTPKMMQAKKKRAQNPNFKKYTDIENLKWYNRLFQDNEIVYISEKLHGTSFRAGWFKNEANTIWKKVLKFFGMLPEWEFCWGSRNVQIQNKLIHNGYYEEDVYTKMVKQYNLKFILPKGYAVYGEIVGQGIQSGYTYGCAVGEHKLYVYDVMKDGEYVGYEHFKYFTDYHGLTIVPELYVGPYAQKIADQHRDGDSLIGGQKVREGIVIKPMVEEQSIVGRKVLKYISEAYYLKQAEDENSTEFH